ncbi:MAG TPA: DUF1990 family protein [Streptosporangiaceae bacterium]|jgi:uncharacterized protein (UPF0548 family)
MSAYKASQLAAAELTYPKPLHTAPFRPSGYHHLRGSRVICSGRDALAAAAQALLAWQIQLRAGLRVTASAPVAEPGAIVLLTVGAGPTGRMQS